MRLSEAIEALCLATRATGRSPRTVQAYREKLAHLLAYLGDVDLAEITADDLRAYAVSQMDRATRYAGTDREQPGGLSAFTVQSRIRALKRLFNWLDEEGRIEANPARTIRVPSPKRREPKGISIADFRAMLATTDAGTALDRRDRAALCFLLDTGCRVAGLCGLRIRDLNLRGGTAVVREKGDKARPLFYGPRTAEALREWLAVRSEDKGPSLFLGLGNRSRGALTPNGVAKMLAKRGELAGVEGPCNAHAFRHGFARMYLLDGGDLATLADLLGHSSVGVTKDYYAVFTLRELQEKHRRHSPLAHLEDSDDEQ